MAHEKLAIVCSYTKVVEAGLAFGAGGTRSFGSGSWWVVGLPAVSGCLYWVCYSGFVVRKASQWI